MENDLLKQLLRHRWELFGLIRSIVRNTAAAEDVFQEVSTAIVGRPGDVKDIQNFAAWAKEIARRQALKYLRDNPARREVSVPADEMIEMAAQAFSESEDEPADASAEHDALRECLKSIGSKAAQLLTLRFVTGLEYGHISRDLRLSEAAVRRAVSRTRLSILDCVTRRLRVAREDA
jgi:RNA polymerase sigma-70 factor (ECF subfamily)